MNDADLAHRLQIAAFRRQSRLAMRKTSQLVPENTVSGNALTIVVAIMSFLACLTLGAVSLVRDASRDWQSDLLREVTIQVRPVEGVDLGGEAAKAATVARLTKGVASVEVLDGKESARLLEPWIGTGLDLSELPIPRLIIVRLANPELVDLAALSSRLKAQVRGATLDDHRSWTAQLRTMANATVAIGLAILTLVFVATILSVIFATRGAMASNRDVISVLHFVGAEDGYVAREFQRHFLLLGSPRRPRGSGGGGDPVRAPELPHRTVDDARLRPGLRALRAFRGRPDRLSRRPRHRLLRRIDDGGHFPPHRLPLSCRRRLRRCPLGAFFCYHRRAHG